MSTFGVIIFTVVATIVWWPTCGVLFYRFMNWFSDLSYDENDISRVFCFGPTILIIWVGLVLLEIYESNNAFWDNANKLTNNFIFLPLKYLAGKPKQAKR